MGEVAREFPISKSRAAGGMQSATRRSLHELAPPKGFGIANHLAPFRIGQWLRRVFTALALLCGSHAAFAQQPGVVLDLESRTMEKGEAIAVRLICTNIGVPLAPEAVVPGGLELKLLSSTPSSNSSIRIINGRRSQTSSYTFSMQLTAISEGTHTLGPITVEAGGATYQTEPVQIVVQKTTAHLGAEGDKYLFAKIDVSPRSLYVSEFAVATLTIGIRKVRINGRVYQVDLLRKVLNQSRSQFSVFAEGDVRQSERQIVDSKGVSHWYEIFHVTKRVRAEQVGTLSIGPVFLKADYPTKLRRGFFGGYDVAQHRRETARAEAILVEVKVAPDDGRPEDYTGAIGRYLMSVSAKPKRVEQGKPVTLTISIAGTPLDGLAGPDLTKQPELASRFDFTKDELVGDKEGDAKLFRRAVFPKQLGEQTIPPIRWSYFDPRKGQYVSLNSDPIAIMVDQPSTRSGSISLTENTPTGPKAASLTVLTGGISPNYINAEEVLANQSFALTVPWLSTIVLGPLAWMIVVLTSRHRSRLRSDAGFARRRRANRKARKRIHKAISNGRFGEPVYVVGEALTGYVSDRCGLGEGTLTSGEVHSLLTSRGVDDALVSKITEFLRSCDAARYAPNTTEAESARRVALQALNWISQLERAMR